MSAAAGSILFGHLGFTLLQTGLCRPKNTSSIIIANLVCFFTAIICYWATGFAFAIPSSASNVFLSHTRFFLIDASAAEQTSFTSHAILASLVVIIMNGGYVERMRFWLYMLLTVLVSGFFYPVSSHWVWNEDGWLKKGINTSDGDLIRYLDYGGTSSVHIFAGGVGLIGCLLSGPRPARIDFTGKFHPLGGQINAYVLIGGLLAFIGLYVKILLLTPASSLTSVNCLLAASSSAIVAFLMKRTGYMGEVWNTRTLVNAALTGIIAVSGAPGTYHPYGGFVIGVVAGIAYTAWHALLVLCRVDDPCDVVSVQLGGGFWGTIAVHLFHKTNGIFYTGTNSSFRHFGWNLLGAVAVFVWAGITTFLILFWFLLCGYLKYRRDSHVHAPGLDVTIHNEPAYPAREHYPEFEEKSIFDTFLTVKADVPEPGYYSGEVYHNAGIDRPTYQDGKASNDRSKIVPQMSIEEQKYQYWMKQQAQGNQRNTPF